MSGNHMVFFGFGFCAEHLVPLLEAEGWQLSATYRDKAKAAILEKRGIAPIGFHAMTRNTLASATHGLISAPPSPDGDPVLAQAKTALAASNIKWLGYLSTTGVYGDHDGAWIDEDTPSGPLGARGIRRAQAEADWLAFGQQHNIGVNLFRLAGIYGAHRNQLTGVKNGTARRIVKPGQVFSRIHVADIAAILHAAILHTQAGRAYSLVDDEPAPPQDVVAYAAALLGLASPPEIAFEAADLSDMAHSFYAENKRIKNHRIKKELGIKLAYPTYREGLRALFEAGAF